jgi:acetyltransferase
MFVKQKHGRYKQDINRVRKTFTTRDGRKIRSRLLTPGDAELLIDLFDTLSPEARRRRFHFAADQLGRDAVMDGALRLSNVDNKTRGGAVLALEEFNGVERIVGVARLMRPLDDFDSPDLEAAIVVRDDYQGTGIATELLRRMILLARQMNGKTIVAEIEADNYPAIKLFRELDLPTTSVTSHGETTLRIQVPE